MDKSASEALAAALWGDVQSILFIQAYSQDELSAVAAGRGLVVARTAVVRVLGDYAHGRTDSADVQRWASFVKRGYLSNRDNEPVRPLDIRFEEAFEELISAAIGRLDELGDSIDGDLGEAEIGELLKSLSVDQ